MNDGMCILAIDPGLSGAMAFLCPAYDKGIVAVYDMPRVQDEVDVHELTRIINKHMPTLAVIEWVGPMPRDGVRQAWRFSAANTSARVVCHLLKLPVVLITPAVWKKGLGVKGGPEGKEQCRLKALQLFPHCAEFFSRKKDTGRAEAALLAYYATDKFVHTFDRPRSLLGHNRKEIV